MINSPSQELYVIVFTTYDEKNGQAPQENQMV